MSLFDQISEDIKKAMLAKDKVALDALRGIKKEFLEAKTAMKAPPKVIIAEGASTKYLTPVIPAPNTILKIMNTKQRTTPSNDAISTKLSPSN